MKIKEWFREHVSIKRGDTEVRDNKGYAFTLGTVGLITGAIMGIVVVILQMVLKSAESTQTAISVFSIVIVVALLAYLVWLLLPMYKSPDINIGSKITTTFLSLICLIIPFVIGVYIAVLAIMGIIIILILWFGLKIRGASSSSSSEPDPDYYRQLGED